VTFQEQTFLASLGWHGTPRFGLEVGLGAVLGGTLTTRDGVDHDVSPGPAGAVSASWLVIYESESAPFLLLSASLAASRVTSDGGVGLVAADARASALVGKTFFQAFTPYLAARVFIGPVAWDARDATGTDAHHFAIGAGARLQLPGKLDVFFEGVPLGERSLSAGAGIAF
jgi:hypothetical protein